MNNVPMQQMQQPMQQMNFPMQQQQMNNFQQMPNFVNRRGRGGQTPVIDPRKGYMREIKFPDIDEKLKVESVIVTTREGSSYDDLFGRVAQKLPEGRVSLYILETRGIEQLLKIMSGQDTKEVEDEIIKKFLFEIGSLDPDCVLFNWECCSGCSDNGFTNGKICIEFIDLLVKKGHILMFSDFAVKALLKQWDENLLGPNPFVKIGECQKTIELHFKCEQLEKCEIPQLEAVGKLCDKGECILKCMGGTVVVGIDWKKVGEAQDKYRIEILTVASKLDGLATKESDFLCEMEEHRGSVGHCAVKFRDGGDMIISAGHWIELQKLDTSIERVESWAKQYGTQYQEDIDYMNDTRNSEVERKGRMKQMSKMFVQQMPSCRNRRMNPVYKKNNF